MLYLRKLILVGFEWFLFPFPLASLLVGILGDMKNIET